jgi:hypothetical protein
VWVYATVAESHGSSAREKGLILLNQVPRTEVVTADEYCTTIVQQFMFPFSYCRLGSGPAPVLELRQQCRVGVGASDD